MKKSIKVSITQNSIFYFIIIIPFIPIEYLSDRIPIWSSICFYFRMIVIVILMYRLLMIRRRFTVTLGLAILFFVVGFISTFLAGVSCYTLFYYSSYFFGLTLLVEDGVFFDIDSFIKGCLFWFEILIYVNLIFYFLNPNGYQVGNANYYLLGNYNTTVRKVFPGIILGALHAFRYKERITLRFCCMFLALFYFLIRVGSLTSVFGMSIFAVAILFYMWRKRSGVFKFEFFIIISVVITVIVAVLRRFNLFENFITVLFGKDMSLSGRTRIWSSTILAIRKKPVWGYGQLSRSDVRGILNGAIDPHNMFLGILFYGGIVGVIALVIILLVILKQIRDGRKTYPQIVMIFDASFCAYFVMWNFEPFSNIDEFYKIFMVFVMAFYCMNFAKNIKLKKI